MPVMERTLTDEQIARFNRDGCLVIPQMFSPTEIC